MRLRRPTLINQMTVGKAGPKDPRLVHSQPNRSAQPDQAQFEVIRRELAGGVVESYARAQHQQLPTDFAVRTVPTRIEYISWSVLCTVSGSPTLLIPKNTRRVAWELPNHFSGATDFIGYSYGSPVFASAGVPYGSLVQPLSVHQADGVTVPINDIYVWFATVPTLIVAYEGIEALEQ